MQRKTRVGIATGASLVAASVLVGVGAAPANAVCETGSTRVYQTTSTERYVGDANNRVYGSSGGTITISQSESWTTSGSVTGTVTAEAGAIFASASASIGVTVGISGTTTQSQGYSWTVPADQATGWVEKGNYGYDIQWEEGYYRSPCVWTVVDSGSAVGVTDNAYFTHS